ncbi:hypothetical protein SAMN05444166_4236 [Singulisphaera sp. GP187]|uniref:hypothetical protein n=1 Tax=Singulisphaera sp. GP187 TaxID=1882752 RepID=UPI00092ADF42|nr:hypothetical protein [Singulisphaera sp. GP187]SIO38031.1 hypothetical protein SAMN05444166_4236 [Singulisphaera sp. GP187]
MAQENYSNQQTTVLVGNINGSTTSLTVASSIGFPTSGQFRALIDDELLLVTTVSGAVWTVVRGVEGTTAASHTDGATVSNPLTRDALLGLSRQSLNGTNVSARRELNFVDGGGVTWNLNDDPTNKKVDVSALIAGPPISAPFVRPRVADFTWINQGAGTAVDNPNGVYLRTPFVGPGAVDMRILVVSVPSPPWKATFRLATYVFGGSSSAGPCFCKSSNGAVSGIATHFDNPGQWRGYYWDTSTSYSGTNDYFLTYNPGTVVNWYRLEDDGTNRNYYISLDGYNFHRIFSVSRTTHFTADAVGFWAACGSSGGDCGILCSSFELT